METQRPALPSRLIYWAAKKGWIRLDQNSLLRRLMSMHYLLKFGLLKTLRAYSPAPYRAIWNLLVGKGEYSFYVPDPPQVDKIPLSPPNFAALLRLLQAGCKIIRVDSSKATLTLDVPPGLRITSRTQNGWDIGILSEIIIERSYGFDFSGQRIIDIGAYIGDTALFFAFRGAEKVIAVEPSPDNYLLAQGNINQNSIYRDRIELLPVAISDRSGEMELHLDTKNPQSHALRSTADNTAYANYREHVMVTVWSLEELICHSGWESVDLVKLDCEGCEFPIILETPDEVLKKVRRWIIEYHANPEPLESRLRALGYQVKRTKDSVMMGLIWAEKP